MQLSLPSELKQLIAELSSPKSLAALARTHTAYQREAEMALYSTLSIFAINDDSLKCMETLAANSEKAALVRSLTVAYARDNINKNRRVTTFLSRCLLNMHSLSDFRVRSWSEEAESEMMMKGLGKILWSVLHLISELGNVTRNSERHFRLQAFYCHDVLDISQIIKSQTELQILGLYTKGSMRIILKTLQELYNAQLLFPIVFMLERKRLYTVPHHISIFPVFYSVDRRATICQELAQSIFKGNHMVASAEDILELSIFLIESSDMPSIYALAKDLAVNFPRIGRLNLWFERRCEIVSFLLIITAPDLLKGC
jgi:hypothetical protein